jgi:hypothetical protein
MVEFMQQGTTATSEMYCETLKKLCGAAIQNKRHGMLTYSVVLLHNNVCVSVPAVTMLRSSLSMYVCFVYDTFFFLSACLVKTVCQMLLS